MDPRSFRDLIAPKILKFSEGVPPKLREDFVQDMWVLALDRFLESFEGQTESEIKNSLDLYLFRAREDWSKHNPKYRIPDEEPTGEASFQPTVQEGIDASRALQSLAGSLRRAHYSEEDVEKVVVGFRDGLSQKEIAEQVGRSPQLLFIHIKNFRSAA